MDRFMETLRLTLISVTTLKIQRNGLVYYVSKRIVLIQESALLNLHAYINNKISKYLFLFLYLFTDFKSV